MRAAVIPAFGAAPAVHEHPRPEREAGQSLVKVRAAALNPVDLLISSGGFYAAELAPPYVPGVEGAGEVVESAKFPIGTRVWFEAGPRGGAFADMVVVDDERIVPIPDGLAFDEAAAAGLAGLAAWLGLRCAGGIAGESVLVLGATGAVGGFAVQAAGLMGAERVVAAGRNRERLAQVGPHETVLLHDDPELRRAELLAAAGEHGFDAVLDLLWAEIAVDALAACAFGARYVQVGHSAGPVARIPAAALRAKSISLCGFAAFSASAEAKRAAYSELAEALAEGALRVDLRLHGLDEVDRLWELQARSPGCKLVARI